MPAKRLHFQALRGGELKWAVVDRYDYILESSKNGDSLRLKATVVVENDRRIRTGASTRIDHIIFDELTHNSDCDWAEALTVFSSDVEFEILLFGKGAEVKKLKCLYFPDWKTEEKHIASTQMNLAFLGLFPNGFNEAGGPLHGIIKDINQKWTSCDKSNGNHWTLSSWLYQSSESSGPENRKAWRVAIKEGGETMRRSLPNLVLWNRYVCTRNGTGNTESRQFTRQHAFALDAFRAELQTLPMPDRFWEPISGEDIGDGRLTFGSTTFRPETEAGTHAESLYGVLLRKYTQLVACGSPTKRNLLGLASLLADPSLRVVLVTGEPGTGKEFFSKAIYFGRHVRQPSKREAGAVFYAKTAREIQNAARANAGQSVGGFLKQQVAEPLKSPFNLGGKPNAPVLLVDELNKADDQFLAELLRPLEQGKTELGTKEDPLFILAASQHIEELAKKPPRDFWTRISHQLRVVHPLSRVSDQDAEKFLRGLFYAEWWRMLETIIRDMKPEEVRRLVTAFLGKVNTDEYEFEPSLLCERVRDEFLNTLVPMVERDELSLRGVRSMLGQMFARISWYVRFENPFAPEMLKADSPEFSTAYANQVARLVNAAVQDVMAILNPARMTSAGMENSGAGGGDKRNDQGS